MTITITTILAGMAPVLCIGMGILYDQVTSSQRAYKALWEEFSEYRRNVMCRETDVLQELSRASTTIHEYKRNHDV